ncbi:MAG TPA: hypothetical protein VFD83_00845 [Candidatus Polarisedimenticolia bacterium]|nr:hypothetical protein [Candidatus Polarisedimenticolia bacterium]
MDAERSLRVLEPKRNDPATMMRRMRRLGRRVRRASLLAGFLLFSCLLFPREASFEVMTLREGYPAKRDLIAPFQFSLLKGSRRPSPGAVDGRATCGPGLLHG